MGRFLISIFALLAYGSLPGRALGADGNVEPLRAFFAGGRVFYSTKTVWNSLSVTELDEKKHHRQLVSFSDRLGRSRWSVGCGNVWVTHFDWFIYRYDLGEFAKGRIQTVPGENPEEASHYLRIEPAEDVKWLGSMTRFQAKAYFDVAPVAPNRLRTFVLTNVRGRLVRITGKTEGLLLTGYEPKISEEDKKVPYWAMNVYECKKDWNPRLRVWESEYEWRLVESILPSFREEFQVIAKGNDYYFLTSPGKLYRTGPFRILVGGRKIEPVWTDAAQPITHYLTDADADRTFLFCKPAKEGEPGVFFELGPKPEPKPYDLSKVKPSKADEPLKGVLERARFLADQKLLKNPDPPKDEKKP